ncbi:39S ribosomal protein L21, mitochondrial isoform X2 [Neoarius graeffei]|uniref:39S ribosomal protein L21, mitochondrial isoform X2 n=1 Tax=Neoarius graeffei TaxID=443677 RepID=UPI00298C5A24|nr:39S ribosomal protein L21, mitochondrial isoform X2 [Neoarius graeffei]
MAAAVRSGQGIARVFQRLGSSSQPALSKHTGCTVPHITHCHREKNTAVPKSYVPETSLSRPPWPELPPYDKEREQQQHQVVEKVNSMLEKREFGRLFAVVHFASRQWKVTSEDLIQIENHIEAECGDQIVLEKVLLVGGENFTLIGKPLLRRDLVRVQATVIEKTESWPMVHMVFWKRHRFQKKRIIVQPQTVLRINSIEVSPALL